jgi:hypothetical protein
MSKRIDSNRVSTQRSDDDLDRLLEALVYLVSQRQMRARWPSRRAVAASERSYRSYVDRCTLPLRAERI